VNKPRHQNEFDSFLNECQTYVWEWYIPEHKVRFGIPSLNSLWLDDPENNIKLDTMLERVHPDDIQKVLVRHNSPLYKSDKMFEVDLRLNVAAELMPDGVSSGHYEWYGFRGKTIRRDDRGRPTYVRGVAINIDQRIRVNKKLLASKDRLLKREEQKTAYFSDMMQEVQNFIRSLASNADSLITGADYGTREERLMKLNQLRDQVAHMLEQSDRMREQLGIPDVKYNERIRTIALWEHMAELQQVYSLKMPAGRKIYFSNLYDNTQLEVNVDLFDVLVENLLNSQLHNATSGYLSMSYSTTTDNRLQLSITCTDSHETQRNFDMVLTESGMGLSICRLIVNRLSGNLEVQAQENGRVQYLVTLPLSLANKEDYIRLDVFDELDERDLEPTDDGKPLRSGIRVLAGSMGNTGLLEHQHLFRLISARNTDELWRHFVEKEPEIVFVDYNLTGSLQIDELIQRMHQHQPDTPVIVTAQYATRVLHHKVRQEGASYLLANPMSLRKVNMMIKRFLK